MQSVASEGYKLPEQLNLDPCTGDLSGRNWIGIEIRFELLQPWYSKDDRPFHVLDNPVRKDRVFGVPYMSAASWKGLLRWACRMEAGLREHLEQHEGKMEGWKDPDWVVHFFGNEKGEEANFRQGALAFYPSWFDKIGFEVINPHSRAKRAGRQPIFYEVVPAGTRGVLRMLYAPVGGVPRLSIGDQIWMLQSLVSAVNSLVTVYGFSAKRTAGWGIAKIYECAVNGAACKGNPIEDLKRKIQSILSRSAEVI
jgi:CRISPR-associated protein Cmr2